MKGQIEIHWTTVQLSVSPDGEKRDYTKHCQVFDPGKDAAAERLFEELKNRNTDRAYDIRFMRIERWASMGGD